MAIQWASYSTETQVRYVVCPDIDAELVFKVTVVPIGADARVSSMRKEHEDSVYSIFRITYTTSLNVEVALTWV